MKMEKGMSSGGVERKTNLQCSRDSILINYFQFSNVLK